MAGCGLYMSLLFHYMCIFLVCWEYIYDPMYTRKCEESPQNQNSNNVREALWNARKPLAHMFSMLKQHNLRMPSISFLHQAVSFSQKRNIQQTNKEMKAGELMQNQSSP